MNPITYKLDINGTAHSTYYPAVASFTDDVLREADKSITPIAKRYRNFLIGFRLEEPRTLEEYVFELLNLGILWRAYGGTALAVRFAPFMFMAKLGEWRKIHPALKPVIDLVRGITLSYFLVPKPIQKTNGAPQSLKDIDRLVTWLEATGDFREDAFRFIRWLGFFGTQNEQMQASMFDIILSFADWFTVQSKKRMGVFTPNIGSFVEANQKKYQWREDRFSCLRSRTEYHMNMVGAEILNRAYRSEFLSCKKRTVLLPGCMRARTEKECEGKKSAKGISCTGCEASCRVRQLHETGKRLGFEVMVIPHSTDLAQWRTEQDKEPEAVVGVACLSVLVQGGWELKRNNVPAQCILLNECGCKKHWHAKGFPTKLDVRELKEIVCHQSHQLPHEHHAKNAGDDPVTIRHTAGRHPEKICAA